MADLSSDTSLDTWDRHTSTRSSSRKPAAPAVRDDWEDDDDDEADGTIDTPEEISSVNSAPSSRVQTPLTDAEDNRELWATANAGVAAPMPTLLTSRSGSVILPPAAAFQPAMRILKRPQSSSPSQNSATVSPPLTETLPEREARYAAARGRIFGLEGSEGTAASPKSSNNVQIIRDPKAPESAPAKQTQSMGFRGRGGKSAPSPRPSATRSTDEAAY